MTLQQLLETGARRLNEAGILEAQLDARYLLMEAFGLSASRFLIDRNREQELDDRHYMDMIEKRSQRIPLQYLLGTQEFMGLEFLVDERVLIPRQDTEDLVELILKEHPGKDQKVLDMCTGSGCIAISLAKLGSYDQVRAVDISEGALEVAKSNAKKLETVHQVECICSDLYRERGQIEIPGGYDVVVSNPPYIPTKVIEGLQPEVRDYEPILALDGTEDGLYFYRRLAKESGGFLRSGGHLYLEIGYDQGKAVSDLLTEEGYTEVTVIKDTPGLDRIVKGKYIGGSHV